VSHRRVIFSLVLTMLLAIGVGGAARQALLRSYQHEVSSELSAANGTAAVAADTLDELQRGAIDESSARERLAQAARAGRGSLAPLLAGPRLRGSFLEASDVEAYERASALDRDLEELEGMVGQHQALGPVAYQAVRLAEYAPGRGGLPSSDPGLVPRLHTLWLHAYAADLRKVDAAFQSKLDTFLQWRAGEFPAWVDAAGPWDEMARRVAQMEADARQTRDQVKEFPVPQEAYHVGENYRTAHARVERALEALGEFAAGKTSDTYPHVVDEQLAAYRSERKQALAELERLVADSRAPGS
jgi:hypothetical protein